MAGEARVYLGAFFSAYLCARRWGGASRLIRERLVDYLCEFGCCAAVDRGFGELSARQAVSDAGMDVPRSVGSVRVWQGTWVLPGSGVSDANGDGSSCGGAVGVVDE